MRRRNGSRKSRWDARVGTIDARSPKPLFESFFSHALLNPRWHSRRGLSKVIAETYVAGALRLEASNAW